MNRKVQPTAVAATLVVLATASIALGGLRQTPNALAASCSSNLKQVCLATLMYVQDYDLRFPPLHNSSRIPGILNPYSKNAQLFRCPATMKPYTFNKGLQPNPKAPANLKEIKSPAVSVLVYDPVAHSDGSWRVGFVDGHVKPYKKLPSLARQ